MSDRNAVISYPIEVSESDWYSLFANLRRDGARTSLKYNIDGGNWSSGFTPFYGERGDVDKNWKMKEAKLGSFYLGKGKHMITFLSQASADQNDRYQNIDYFYLTKDSQPK